MKRKIGKLLTRLIELHQESERNDYLCMLDADGVRELLSIYMDEYIPMEKIGLYEHDELIRKLLQQMTAVYKLETTEVGKNPDLTEVVTNVTYKDGNMYIKFKPMAKVKVMRLKAGLSQTELAVKSGYKLVTIQRCELSSCDMTRQPEEMRLRLAEALSCEPEDLL